MSMNELNSAARDLMSVRQMRSCPITDIGLTGLVDGFQ